MKIKVITFNLFKGKENTYIVKISVSDKKIQFKEK